MPRPSARAEEVPDGDEVEAPRERVLPRSPIYPRADDGREHEPGGSREIVLRILRDGRYHGIEELLGGVRAERLVAGLGMLLDSGHALDRAGEFLRLRSRGEREPRQRLLEVLDGLCLTTPPPESEEAPDFDPAADAGVPEAAGGSLLALSDPPGDLSLPLATWGSSTRAILAKRGSGKTYLAGVMLEEVLPRADRPAVVVIDPSGVWWGLLSTAEGEPSSHEVLLLGGRRGHLPLGARDGAAAADVVAELRPLPVILDLSSLVPVEQHEVVADFCDRLWAREQFPIHLVVDEADEFVPQRFGALPHHQRRSLDFLARIFMRGRVRGMAGTLISLRPAVLSKNLLSQVDELCLGRLAEPHDISAARSWLEDYEHHVTPQQRAACLGSLTVLPVGTIYYLRGGDRPMFRRFHVREKRTYDSSRALVAGTRVDPPLSAPPAAVLELARKILSSRPAGGEDGDG